MKFSLPADRNNHVDTSVMFLRHPVEVKKKISLYSPSNCQAKKQRWKLELITQSQQLKC